MLLINYIDVLVSISLQIQKNIKQLVVYLILYTGSVKIIPLIILPIISKFILQLSIILHQYLVLTNQTFNEKIEIYLLLKRVLILEQVLAKKLTRLVQHLDLTNSNIQCFSLLNTDNKLYYNLSYISIEVKKFFIVKPNTFTFTISTIQQCIIARTIQIGVLSNSLLNSQIIYNTNKTVFVFTGLSILIIITFGISKIIQFLQKPSLVVVNTIATYIQKRIHLYFSNILNKLILTLKKNWYLQQENSQLLITDKTKLEILFHNMANGVILLDSKLQISIINPRALKELEWLNQPVIGSHISNHLPKHTNNLLLPVLDDIISKNYHNLEKQESSIYIQTNEDKVLRLSLTLAFKQNYPLPIGIIITIQNITQEVESNIAKNQLIHNVSHELYTPLSNIRSFLETPYEYYDSLNKSKKLEFLKLANQETVRLTSLVNNMLDSSHLESQQNYTKNKMDIRSTIDYVIHTYQLTAKHKQIQIIMETPTHLYSILGNNNLLVQVIGNLVNNSIKFTHDNSYIIIRTYNITERLKGYTSPKSNLYSHKVRVEIIDEGIGISKVAQKQIFQRFWQINNITNNLRGKGLGLTIVKTLINKHNSSIKFHSEIHVGSCFWFDLAIITVKDTE